MDGQENAGGGPRRRSGRSAEALHAERAHFRLARSSRGLGNLLSRARRPLCVEQVMAELGVSERRACRVLGQHRSTHLKIPRGRADEAALIADIVALATRYGRYGYRRIAAILRYAGWVVNAKRMLNLIDEFPREYRAMRSTGSSDQPTSSTSRQTCSISTACRDTSAIGQRHRPPLADGGTMANHRQSGAGVDRRRPRGPPLSSPAVRRRTATARASTRNSETNCSTAKSSTASPRRGP